MSPKLLEYFALQAAFDITKNPDLREKLARYILFELSMQDLDDMEMFESRVLDLLDQYPECAEE